MVKKLVFIILAAGTVVYLMSCGKKQQALEEMQAPMSIETLATTETKATTPEATTVQPAEIPQAEVRVVGTKLESVPLAGPTQPTTTEIQTALKNAGFYTGLIDGKIGPMTKKAVEEFQKANNLQVDGKVGPKTWVVLSKYLTAATPPPAKKR